VSNPTVPILVGVDISKAWFDVATPNGTGAVRERRFDNDADGHRAFIAWLSRGGGPARVVVEATGTYGLDLALALHADDRTEVMVANPRLVRGFAQALAQRSKTDKADARTILAFAERMPFEPWEPPEEAVLELRAMARRIADLTVERTREKNRLAALKASAASSAIVMNDVEVVRADTGPLRHLDRRIDRLIEQAVTLVEADTELSKAYGHLTSVKGIAAKSAVAILPELLVLPRDMTAKQWVAHAGLDPREYESGSSVRGRVRISKVGSVHLRRALYMPAVVAARQEPRVKAFYEELLARGKRPMVANVAVMRKLLHAIHGMLRHDADFDGEKFRATPQKASVSP
jgi:transposase